MINFLWDNLFLRDQEKKDLVKLLRKTLFVSTSESH